MTVECTINTPCPDTYILLTKHEGHTGKISAWGLDSTGWAMLGPYKKRQRADILPVQSQASEVNKRFITWVKKFLIDRRWQQKGLGTIGILTKHLKGVLVEKKVQENFLCQWILLFLFSKPLQHTNHAQDHSGLSLVQYLEKIGPAKEQSDWLI